MRRKKVADGAIFGFIIVGIGTHFSPKLLNRHGGEERAGQLQRAHEERQRVRAPVGAGAAEHVRRVVHEGEAPGQGLHRHQGECHAESGEGCFVFYCGGKVNT